MNGNVLDIDDLAQNSRFFKTWIGRTLTKLVFKWTDMDKVNRIHSNHCELRGSAYTSAMLRDPLMDVRYEVHNREILEQLPEGAFITVSNHPIGSLDGIILIDLFASIRPDYKLMVNNILSHVTAMGDNFISVIPTTGSNSVKNTNANTYGIRMSLSHLRDGHPMGFFPAGAMSTYNKKLGRVHDRPWTHSVIRLIRKAGVPVIPVYFDCLNSKCFYRLGRISWRLRTVRVAKEAFNKQGQTLHLYLGQPISPDKIKKFADDDELGKYLCDMTYKLTPQ